MQYPSYSLSRSIIIILRINRQQLHDPDSTIRAASKDISEGASTINCKLKSFPHCGRWFSSWNLNKKELQEQQSHSLPWGRFKENLSHSPWWTGMLSWQVFSKYFPQIKLYFIYICSYTILCEMITKIPECSEYLINNNPEQGTLLLKYKKIK